MASETEDLAAIEAGSLPATALPPAKACSVAVVGVRGHLIEVEVHLASAVPGFTLVGLPDTALTEARDRVRAAIENSGQVWPNRRIIVGLSPATLPKSGSHYDLAIGICILAVSGVVPRDALEEALFLGELGLDGRLRPIRGTLPSVLGASEAGYRTVIVPEGNAAEAKLVEGVEVIGVRSLRQVIALLCDEPPPEEPGVSGPPGHSDRSELVATADRLAGLDLGDVLGQTEARRAVEVAAAGGHHLYLQGPPGAGKTMLAERIPGLLPDLSRAEAMEVTAIHSVAGVLPHDRPLVTRPPYADPHHTATQVSVVGGGSGVIRPGAMSLAHRGVLFLDEAPEWRPTVLDALRQPLEKGEIEVYRAAGVAIFPARFLLVLAANPCPCGNANGDGLACSCTSQARRRYHSRLSGPIKDRIDITLSVPPVGKADLVADRRHIETTAVVAARVADARQRQTWRYRGRPWTLNAHVPGPVMRREWPPDSGAMNALDAGRSAARRLSARGADRVLRVAWTLADLAGLERPGSEQLLSALTLRLGHQAAEGWGFD